MSSPTVRRGTLYWLDWNAARGSEQAGRRPALVVQENPASANPNYPLTIVVAISTKGRRVASHILINPSQQNGLATASYIKCEQIQTVSKDRLDKQFGELDADDMKRVDIALNQVLAIS